MSVESLAEIPRISITLWTLKIQGRKSCDIEISPAQVGVVGDRAAVSFNESGLQDVLDCIPSLLGKNPSNLERVNH